MSQYFDVREKKKCSMKEEVDALQKPRFVGDKPPVTKVLAVDGAPSARVCVTERARSTPVERKKK